MKKEGKYKIEKNPTEKLSPNDDMIGGSEIASIIRKAFCNIEINDINFFVCLDV